MADIGNYRKFLDCIKDFIEPDFLTPLHPTIEEETGNLLYTENLDIGSNSVLYNKERCIYIGKKTDFTYHDKPLFDIKTIPVSDLSTLNLLQIQAFLQSWKAKYDKDGD